MIALFGILLLGQIFAYQLQAPEAYLVSVTSPVDVGVIVAGGASSTSMGGEWPVGPYSSVVQTLGSSSNFSNYQLSVPRAALAAATIGKTLIYAGGMTDKMYTDVVDVFGDTTQTFSLSEPRAYLTGASTTNSAYFVGGYGNDGARSDVIDRYYLPKQTWSTLNLPLPRSNHTSIGAAGYIFIAGGYIETDPPTVTDLVDIIAEDLDTGNAEFIAPLEVFGNRTNLVSTAIHYQDNTYVFFAGGEGPSCGCEIGWMCTPDFSFCTSGLVNILTIPDNDTATIADSWSLFGSIECRTSLAAAGYGNLVLFAGGKNVTGWSGMVDIYNLDTGEWTQDQLSVPRGHLVASTSSDGKIFFSGGVNDLGVSSVVDVYDAKSGKWVV